MNSRVIGLILTVVLVFSVSPQAFASTTGSVKINVSLNFIGISVSPVSYNFGSVGINSTYNTTYNYFNLTNSSSIETDHTVSVNNSFWLGGINWTHNDTCTPGIDTAGLKVCRNNTWYPGNITHKGSFTNYHDLKSTGNWLLTGTNWSAGDLGVFVWFSENDDEVLTEDTDITQKWDTIKNKAHIFIGYRVLQEGDVSFSWSTNHSCYCIFILSVYGNVSTLGGDPFEAESGEPIDQLVTYPDPPAVTVNTSYALVVPIFGKKDSYTSITNPSGYSSGGRLSRILASHERSSAVAWRLVSSTGSEDPGIWNLSSSGSAVVLVWTGVLRPYTDTDIIVKYSSPNYIYENCPAVTNYTFGVKLWSPTYFSDGIVKRIKVIVLASAS